jgi:hypothetical protein
MYWVKQLFGGNRKVSMAATVEHVELTSSHLYLGLTFEWLNETRNPILIREIRLWLYLNGRGEDPLRFHPLERFAHVIGHLGIQKSPLSPFKLPVKQVYTDSLRFICQDVRDLPVDTYAAEIEAKDDDGNSYLTRTHLVVENSMKYRRSDE